MDTETFRCCHDNYFCTGGDFCKSRGNSFQSYLNNPNYTHIEDVMDSYHLLTDPEDLLKAFKIAIEKDWFDKADAIMKLIVNKPVTDKPCYLTQILSFLAWLRQRVPEGKEAALKMAEDSLKFCEIKPGEKYLRLSFLTAVRFEDKDMCLVILPYLKVHQREEIFWEIANLSDEISSFDFDIMVSLTKVAGFKLYWEDIKTIFLWAMFNGYYDFGAACFNVLAPKSLEISLSRLFYSHNEAEGKDKESLGVIIETVLEFENLVISDNLMKCQYVIESIYYNQVFDVYTRRMTCQCGLSDM